MKNCKYNKCNMCGREILVNNGIIKEGIFKVAYDWNYFSKKDGEVHNIAMCEACYDELIKQFKIPVYIEEITEMI